MEDDRLGWVHGRPVVKGVELFGVRVAEMVGVGVVCAFLSIMIWAVRSPGALGMDSTNRF